MKRFPKLLKYAVCSVLGFLFLTTIALIGVGLTVELPGEQITPAGVTRYNSQYLIMRDGVEIAVDVWLPKEYSLGQKLPSVIVASRYGRAFNVRFPYRVMIGLGLAKPLNYKGSIQRFNENGYVMVKVDARGSGASKGERNYDLPVDELKDYGEVIEWITQQPWSNGKVGATGSSYPGMTAEMMTMNNHPALRAIAPRYNYFDVYHNLSFPGGVFDRYFMEDWSHLTEAMDENRCFIYGSDFDCWKFRQLIGGVKPVEIPGGEEIYEEIYRNRDNPTVLENLEGVKFRDDTMRSGGKLRSPYLNAEYTSASGVAMKVIVGWHDSATADGAIARFKTLSNKQDVIIGPLSHGGRHDTNPFAEQDIGGKFPEKNQSEILIDFFDLYLKETDGPKDRPHQITYYTMGEDKYNTTPVWPPAGIANQRWSFGANGSLVQGEGSLSKAKAADMYKVDFSATTGSSSRWYSIGGPDIVYPDRREEDKKLLTYTSAPLKADLEITGPPQVTLNIASTHSDGALHVYLEDVAPDGRVTYITEGVLALSHRAISDNPPYVVDTVYHSSERADAKPMIPGVVEEVVVPLYNTSVVIKRGHKVRIAIAGADKDTFARVPEEGDPTLTVHRSAAFPSFVDFPQRWRD